MGNFKILYLISIFLFQDQFSNAQELRVGDLSFNLDSLSETDSIRLSGYISDCGEFGGHLEFIVLKKESGYISANFSQEPPCTALDHFVPATLKHRNEILSEKEERLSLKTEIKITNREIAIFQKYFKEFQDIGQDCGDNESNTKSEFSIETPAWQKARVDKCNQSKIFVNLRDQLFLQ